MGEVIQKDQPRKVSLELAIGKEISHTPKVKEENEVELSQVSQYSMEEIISIWGSPLLGIFLKRWKWLDPLC